eukprot:m.36513 g.36513  ORF g.36513 m.36513 type:complete len:205 (-) comp11026_c0_seq2:2428-3042(-)
MACLMMSVVLFFVLACSPKAWCLTAGDTAIHNQAQGRRKPMSWRHALKLAKANGMTCDTGGTPLTLRLEPPSACVMRSTPTGHEIYLDPTNYFARNMSVIHGCGTAYWATPPFGNTPQCIFFANVGEGRACHALRCAKGTGYAYTHYDPATSLPPAYTCQSDGSFTLEAHGATDSGLGCQPCPSNTYNDGSSHACEPKKSCGQG